MRGFYKKHKFWFHISSIIFGVVLLSSGIPMLLVGGNHQVTYLKNNETTTEHFGLLNYEPKLHNETDLIAFVTGYRNKQWRSDLSSQINNLKNLIQHETNADKLSSHKNDIHYKESLLNIPLMYDVAIAGAIFTSFGVVGVIGGVSLIIDLHKNKIFNKKTQNLTA